MFRRDYIRDQRMHEREFSAITHDFWAEVKLKFAQLGNVDPVRFQDVHERSASSADLALNNRRVWADGRGDLISLTGRTYHLANGAVQGLMIDSSSASASAVDPGLAIVPFCAPCGAGASMGRAIPPEPLHRCIDGSCDALANCPPEGPPRHDADGVIPYYINIEGRSDAYFACTKLQI